MSTIEEIRLIGFFFAQRRWKPKVQPIDSTPDTQSPLPAKKVCPNYIRFAFNNRMPETGKTLDNVCHTEIVSKQ